MNRNIIIVLTIFLAIFFTLLTAPNGNAGEIYIWTDANGVEHISNQPPSEEIKPKETMQNGNSAGLSLDESHKGSDICIKLMDGYSLLLDEKSENFRRHMEWFNKDYKARLNGFQDMYEEEELELNRGLKILRKD